MNAKTAFGDDQSRNPALPDPRPDYACRCPAINHDHAWGAQCERLATYAGGICVECRYFHTFPERQDNLG
jgi:hypothetical protein